MKWLIMFKGGVETQEFFSIELAKTFENAGYHIYWYDLIVEQDSSCKLKNFYENNKNDTIITFTFNFNGIAGEAGLYDADSGYNFWNESGIPVVNMVVDHPLYYYKYKKCLPHKYRQISIDRNHERYLERFFPEVQSGGFIPLGGTAINEYGSVLKDKKFLPMNERPIDVIFTGNYTPPESFEKYLSGMDGEYAAFYKSLVEESQTNVDELIEDIFERRIKQENSDEVITDSQLAACMPDMMYVDLSVRFYYRGQVIRSLVDNGIKVHTFGAGWNMLECNHPENIITAGNVDSQTCLDVISQSKVSVNVMPWFKDGAHDRIYNSILNGAVCMTDESIFLKEQFNDKENVLFYSLKNIGEVPDIVLSIISDNSRLSDMAESAYNTCIVRDRWSDRAKDIIKVLEKTY